MNREVDVVTEPITITKYNDEKSSAFVVIKETRDTLTIDEKNMTILKAKTSTNLLMSTIDMTKFGATEGAFIVNFNVAIYAKQKYFYTIKGHSMFFWDGEKIPLLKRFKIEGQYSSSKYHLWNFSFYRATNKLIPRVRNKSSEELNDVRMTMKFFITTTSDRIAEIKDEKILDDDK